MDQILKLSKRAISLVMLMTSCSLLFSGCEKEVKKVDLFEAEIDGVVYNLKTVNITATEGQYLYLQGDYENDELGLTVALDFCNLFGWPQQNRFPIFQDSCADKTVAISQTQVNFLYKPRFFVSYTTYNELPDGFSEVVLEAFRTVSSEDYNIKGTYRMYLPRVENDPPNTADSLLVTGRFHFLRIPRDRD